jgi:hypothetical protein
MVFISGSFTVNAPRFNVRTSPLAVVVEVPWGARPVVEGVTRVGPPGGGMGKRVVAFRAADHALLWLSQVAPLLSWLVPPTLTADGRILRFFMDPDTGLDKRVFGRGTVPVGDRYYLPTQGRLAAHDTAGPLLWLTEDTGNGVTEPAVGPDGTLYTQNRGHGL